MTTDPRARNDEAFLLEAARFVKACSLYAAGHDRIRESTDQLLDALRRCGADAAGRVVRFTIRRREPFLDGRSVPTGHSLVSWLIDLLRRARVAGIEFTKEADPPSLHALARTLIDAGFRGAVPTAQGGELRGVRLIELKFLGIHTTDPNAVTPQSAVPEHANDGATTGSGQATLARLAGDQRVRSMVDSLRARMPVAPGDGAEDVEIDLIPHLVGIVTEEVGEAAPEVIHEHVVASLERIVQMAPGWLDAARSGAAPAPVTHGAMSRAAQAVAQRFFARDIEPQILASDELPTGRPEDESIDSQLETLLDEFEALPDEGPGTLRVESDEVSAQLASIWLHLIAHPMRPPTRARASRRLKDLLTANPDLELSELRAYRADEDDTDPAVGARVMTALLEQGLASRLVAHSAIDPVLLARSFPIGFSHAIDCLESGAAGLADVIAAALGSLTPDALRSGVRKLLRGGQIDGKTLRTLLTARIREFAPAIDEQALGDDASLNLLMIRTLRSMPLPEPEGSALCTLPEDFLPTSFVAGMAHATLTATDRKAVRAEAGRLLRDFVRYHAWSTDHETCCTAVVGVLAEFPSVETRECLRTAARGRFLGGSATRAVRRAARRVLKAMGGSPCA